MTSSRLSNTSGFTLVEIMMVLIILSVVSVMGVGIFGDTTDASRFEQTRAQMETLKAAILGNIPLNPQGRRSNFGYAGDWGSLPTLLSNLTTAQTPAWAYDSTYGFGTGWKGPYLDPTFNGAIPEKDGWGRTFVWAPTGGPPATLTSLGADGVAGGTLYDADLVVELPFTQWRGNVRGRVLNGVKPLEGRTVVIRYPVAGVLTTSSAVTTDANGAFSFSNIPFGVRSLSVTSTPTMGPKQIIVDTSEVEVPPETLNYLAPEIDINAVCCRLSLSSTTAVTTTDLTNQSTIYFVPYKGNTIPLYDGTTWENHTVSAAISNSLSVTDDTNFDIFIYDNNGTLTLETVAWSNSGAGTSARATALSTQDGILVKSTDAKRRYLGTGRTTGTANRIEDSEDSRFLWNYYNRVPRPLKALKTISSWRYDSSTWRSAQGDPCTTVANIGETCVTLVVGVAEALLNLTVLVRARNLSDAWHYVGIGEDRTNGSDADQNGGNFTSSRKLIQGFLKKNPSAGYHYYQWVEAGAGTGRTDFYTEGSGPGMGLTGFIDG